MNDETPSSIFARITSSAGKNRAKHSNLAKQQRRSVIIVLRQVTRWGYSKDNEAPGWYALERSEGRDCGWSRFANNVKRDATVQHR